MKLKGYRILEKRYRAPVGEIDLIAYKKGVLVACEIKARKTVEDGMHCLTAHQKNRILRALSLYVSRNPQYTKDDLRVDFLLLTGWRLCHIKGAWDTSL